MLGQFYIFDLVFILILLISGVLAFARGFFREVLAIISWIVSIYVAIYFFSAAQPFLRDKISVPEVADLATFMGLFVASLIVCSLLSTLIASRLRSRHLGPVDRSLGFIFGLLRGVLIFSLIYLLFSQIVPTIEQPQWIQNAKTVTIVDTVAHKVNRLIPESWIKKLGEFATQLEGEAEKKVPPLHNTQPKLNEPPKNDVFERLNEPPVEGVKPTPKEGYNQKDRQNMDRMIEQIQQEGAGTGAETKDENPPEKPSNP